MLKRILPIFIAALLFMACSAKIEEVIEETYDDGSPKMARFYSKDGQDKILVKELSYYPNKKIRYEGEFKEDEKHGHWIYYYEDGKTWSEGYFKMGERNGESYVWHENGQQKIHGYYTDGIRTGLWQFWDDKGTLEKEIDYEK
jgi:antitoxin component YwqK of YwqJK toxin-antitoxin module